MAREKQCSAKGSAYWIDLPLFAYFRGLAPLGLSASEKLPV
jgi:hypothetical protein